MLKIIPFYLFGLIVLSGCASKNSETEAQTISDRFEAQIHSFERIDQEEGYQQGCILFTGSSSIRMWESLRQDFEGLPVLNRGFGGATTPEVDHFAYRYLFDHSPQIVVLYCGENDIAEGASPQETYDRFVKFTEQLNGRLPNTQLVYISMKPSPARWKLWGKFLKAEEKIEAYIAEQEMMHYFDSGLSMLHENGEPKGEIFIEDGLHMNELGYAGWTERLRPLIERLYQPNLVPGVTQPATSQ